MTKLEKQITTCKIKRLYISISEKGYRIQDMKDYDSEYCKLVDEVKEETLQVNKLLKEIEKGKI